MWNENELTVLLDAVYHGRRLEPAVGIRLEAADLIEVLPRTFRGARLTPKGKEVYKALTEHRSMPDVLTFYGLRGKRPHKCKRPEEENYEEKCDP
jgi:hypothetical protein